ncbi:MAG: DNA translocase FtsK [Actinomycetia bacterium]|nr:DNA translocase FtsK [Actinomycetes bacterium]
MDTSPSVSRAFEGHGRELAGIALVVTGLVAALSIYANLTGPLGGLLAKGIAALVGLLRFFVPPLLLAGGLKLIRGVDEDEPPGDGRVGVGSTLVILAVSGGLHVTLIGSEVGPPLDVISDAGGLLGAFIGSPLRSLLAIWGALLVLITVGLVGGIVLTGASVRSAAVLLIETTTRAGRAVISGLSRLVESAEGPLEPVLDESVDRSAVGPPIEVAGEAPAQGKSAPAAEEAAPVAEAPFDQDTSTRAAAPLPKPAKAEANKAAKSQSVGEPTIHVPDPQSLDPEQLEINLGRAADGSAWRLPSLSLLNRSDSQEVDRAAIAESGRVLERALAEHGVETRLVNTVVGPTVSRYELELGPGVKVARVTSLHKDIAYAMASPDVRILAPIPGKQAIGVEVPNPDRQIVAVGDILTSPEAAEAQHPLEVAVGRDINGVAVMANLAAQPHVLIAGATGAGKSSCINSLITSILMRATPDQVRMILVDPKMVELGQYNRLPHLLTEVVTDPKKAANALSWAVREMERRYELLSEVGVRDITGYNKSHDDGTLAPRNGRPSVDSEGRPVEYQKLPFILVVLDELADLMMVAARDVEESICRIAQKARAVGIHLVIATQRPSTNVITGLIKANVPARWAFAVSSLTDSRVVLDQAGAERLVGKGDMLMVGASSSTAKRIQGAWVTEEEVRAIVTAWRDQSPEPVYSTNVQEEAATEAAQALPGGTTGDNGDDDLLVQAMELVVRSQFGSTSMLQRKLRVGFARAGRLMDLLEERGVVGPSTGSKAREVLLTPEQLDGGMPSGGVAPNGGADGLVVDLTGTEEAGIGVDLTEGVDLTDPVDHASAPIGEGDDWGGDDPAYAPPPGYPE